MALKDRLSRPLKDLLSALLAPAEDPRQVYADAVARQRDLLAQVRLAMTRLAAVEERLASTAATVRRRVAALEEEATRELLSDQEQTARLALQRHQVALQELRALDKQLGEVGRERQRLALSEQRLALSEQRLTVQIETFRAREEMIAARYSAAEARVKMGEVLSGLTHELSDLDQTLRATQRQTEHLQARAAALDEVAGGELLTEIGHPPADALERELAALETEQAVERQFTALQQELARSAGAGQSP